jgi:hypothetical protein
MPVRTAVDHAVRMEERKRTCELLREVTDLTPREVSLVVDDKVEDGLGCVLAAFSLCRGPLGHVGIGARMSQMTHPWHLHKILRQSPFIDHCSARPLYQHMALIEVRSNHQE